MILITALVAALSFRLIPVAGLFIFDGIVILIAWFCIYEVMAVKKLDKKGVRDYYLYPYVTIAYMLFLIGILVDNPFPFWLHLVLQGIVVFILCVYVYLMSYTDKAFIKQANLQKKNHGKECRRVVLDYLKLIIYPGLVLLTLIPLNHMSRWAEVTPTGMSSAVPVSSLGLFAILLVFGITVLTDTFAHAVGKTLKGRKLAPKISPGKHISGAVGGLFGGVLGALLVLLVMTTSSTLQQFLVDKIGYAGPVNLFFIGVGLVGSVMTQAGDLFASWIKRKNGVKDFGKWLPGHGGLMDRFDGLMWNAPFILVIMMIITFVA